MDIYYFFSSTCSSCKKTSNYLEEIKGKYNNINIKKYNIYDENNKKYLYSYCKEYNVNKEDIGLVPIVFVRDKYILDYGNIENNIENYICNRTKVLYKL